MTQVNSQGQKKKFPHASLLCQTLGLLLLAGIVPVSSRAQNANQVVGPKPRAAATTSTTSKTESKVSGTIQQIVSKHGSLQLVIEGKDGAVTADLGPFAGNAAKSLSAGDRVEISGWTSTSSNGSSLFIAREITAGERQVVIRNSAGMPVHPVPATSTKPQRVGTGFTGGAR
jgi:hypothetical protein